MSALARTHLVRVRTPEGVAFSFRLASPVLRAAARLIDIAAVLAAWSMLAVVLGLLSLISQDFAGLVGTVGFFLVSQGYVIVAEWGWGGQTLGKRLLRLRVVDAQGLRLTFAQVVARNVLRFADALPVCYLVGGIAALVTARAQRLGDLVGGTLVIWEPAQPLPDLAQLRAGKYNTLRSHAPAVARLRQAVSPVEAQAAWSAVARRDELLPDARIRLFRDLARHFVQVGSVPAEGVDGVSDEQFVRNVVDVLYVSRD